MFSIASLFDNYFYFLFSPVTALIQVCNQPAVQALLDSEAFIVAGLYVFAALIFISVVAGDEFQNPWFSRLKLLFATAAFLFTTLFIIQYGSIFFEKNGSFGIVAKTYGFELSVLGLTIVVASFYFKSLKSTLSVGLGYVFFPMVCTALYMLVTSNTNLIQLFVLILFVSICFYFMLAETKRASALESSIKYYSLGLLSSGLMLFGILLVYGEFVSVSYEELKVLGALRQHFVGGLAVPTLLETMGLSLIIFGFLFKLSVFPMHIWVSDVYEGATTRVLMLMATVLKVAIAFAFADVLVAFGYVQNQLWAFILVIAGIGSLIIGSFGGLMQQKVKRLVAFSSINHMGFLVLGYAGSPDTLFAGLFYLGVYVVSVVIFFGVLLFFRRRNGAAVTYLTDLSQIWFYQPTYIRLLLLASLFTMAGLPPFALFFSKFSIMLQGTYAITGLFGTVTILALMVVSVFNYLRVIKYMCFRIEAPRNTFTLVARPAQVGVLWVLVFGLICVSVFLPTVVSSLMGPTFFSVFEENSLSAIIRSVLF